MRNIMFLQNENDKVEEICKAKSLRRTFWEGLGALYTSCKEFFQSALTYVQRKAIGY